MAAQPLRKDESSISTRTNFDKQSLRRMYREHFKRAIASKSAASGSSLPVLQYGTGDSTNVQVYVRKRPLFPEEAQADYDVITVDADGAPTVFDARLQSDMQRAYLDCHRYPIPCLAEDATNAEVCSRIQLPELLNMARDGGNATCLMFGQTGSGKTHSMSAIMEASAHLLFHPSTAGASVQVSCFQVAGKDVFDLLTAGEKLAVREDSKGIIQVSASRQEVASAGAMLELLSFAASQRLTGGTLKNRDSSRSHAFYRLTITPQGGETTGSVTFVDLAGSERGGDSMFHDAEQRKQGAAINASLAVLKECVRLRRRGSARVPYRNNRLTMLLRQSFEPAPGCAARMVLLVTVSPGAGDTEHSINTIRNACLMAGLDVSASVVTRAPVSLTGCDAHQQVFKTQCKHPSKWDAKEVAAWFSAVGKGAFSDAGNLLGKSTDGKALCRLPESRFQQLCGSDSQRGSCLYQHLKNEIDAANRSKLRVTEALRNAKAAK